MSIWDRLRPAAPVVTPSDAARILSQVAAEQRIAKEGMTRLLSDFVAAGGVAQLGWKQS